MKKFLVKRIGYMIVTLVIIITATFYMMHSIPGDPGLPTCKKSS